MNTYCFKILTFLHKNPGLNQRKISSGTGISLGKVSMSIRTLKADGYLTDSMSLSQKALELMEQSKPKNAVILAAGYGLRMVPINLSQPKAFLTVHGEPIIERLILQLHEVGITDITVVVGYMKESFDYLIDKFGVKLVYNRFYSERNNLHSLNCVVEELSNTYIIPCNLWCKENPFNPAEVYTWYMVSNKIDPSSAVRVTRHQEVKKSHNLIIRNGMVGIAYIHENDASVFKEQLKKLCADAENDFTYWEKALFLDRRIEVKANLCRDNQVFLINSYEQLRDVDCNSEELNNDSMSVICQVLGCQNKDIVNIQSLKKGMTNRSYIFEVKGKRYIMRIPGEGTDKLINRRQEAQVYNAIKGRDICDELFYINPENGMKISAFVEGSRCCDPLDDRDLKRCMKKLRNFHSLGLKVDHRFDIFGQIEFYQSLWGANESIFKDYQETKAKVLSLKSYIQSFKAPECLTHIDAVPDNFLFCAKLGEPGIQLIDWEYSGMQDPHVDIAMFCIYSMYNKQQIDHLIDIYFENHCDPQIRTKIYCYISCCGLLWSNWCEYKRQLGVEFGEYSLKQYRYAKDFYRHALEAGAQPGTLTRSF